MSVYLIFPFKKQSTATSFDPFNTIGDDLGLLSESHPNFKPGNFLRSGSKKVNFPILDNDSFFKKIIDKIK